MTSYDFSTSKKNLDDLSVGRADYGDSASINTAENIIIGSTYDESVVVFKAFVKDISYDLSKKIEESHNPTQDYHNFASFAGEMKIQISVAVPAANLLEAKNNYAKISHLQNTVLYPSIPTSIGASRKNWHYVYFSNLISNGMTNTLLVPRSESNQTGEIVLVNDQPTEFEDLRMLGLPSIINDISYDPDFSAGFVKDSDGSLYAKAYELKLTLVPDTQKMINSEYFSGRTFISAFIDNGQYDSQDSCFFPFRVGVGKSNLESGYFRRFHDSDDLYDLSKDNRNIIARSADSFIYISLPNDKETDNTDKVREPNLTGTSVNIRRELVFPAFIDSFSRKFSNSLKMDSGDTDNAVSQTHTSAGFFTSPPEWSFSFNVPAANIEEGKINCGKMQYLMRMFYRRRQSEKVPRDQRLLDSVRVFIPSFIGHSNSMVNDLDSAYENGYTLQITSLSIEIDSKMGFFEKNGLYFPKVFKVSIDLKDSIIQNYRKFNEWTGDLIVDQYSNKVPLSNIIDNNPNQSKTFISNLDYWTP